MSQALIEIGAAAAARFSEGVGETTFDRGQATLHTTHERLVDLMTWLRDDTDCMFRQLIDVTAVD